MDTEVNKQKPLERRKIHVSKYVTNIREAKVKNAQHFTSTTTLNQVARLKIPALYLKVVGNPTKLTVSIMGSIAMFEWTMLRS